MVPKPSRKEKALVKETMLAIQDKVAMNKIKCKGVHLLLPKIASKAQIDLCAFLTRMGCMGLMDSPWNLNRPQLLKEITTRVIPTEHNKKLQA